MVSIALSASDVAVSVDGTHGFRDIDIELQAGEAVALTCLGTEDLSLLLEVFAGLRKPERGRVNWDRLPALSILEDDRAPTSKRYRTLRWLRQSNAYVSDSVALFANLTLYDNVALPLRYHFNAPERLVAERTLYMLELLKLVEVADQRPAWVSRGLRRRASLGRALILEPSALFLESTISDIDHDSAEIMISALQRYRKTSRMTILASSYEPRLLLPLVSRVFIFHEGRIARVLEGDALEEKLFLDEMNRMQTHSSSEAKT